jgi:hypothetical protein
LAACIQQFLDTSSNAFDIDFDRCGSAVGDLAIRR